MTQAHRQLTCLLVRGTVVVLALCAQLPVRAQENAPVPDGSRLATRVSLARSALDAGEGSALAVVFENRGDRPIPRLRILALEAEGFEPGEARWYASGDASISGDGLGATVALPPGTAVSLAVRLRSTGEVGRFTPRIIYAWRDAAQLRHQGIVWAGPIEVKSWWSTIRAPVVDLAWPVVILILGWWLKTALQKRTETQQILHLMLPKIHENAEKYYMPLCTKIRRLDEVWQELGHADSEVEWNKLFNMLFYELWVLLMIDDRMNREIGGWYLKNRNGEDCADECWEPFRSELERRLDRDRIHRVLHVIRGIDVDDYVAVMGRFESEDDEKTVREDDGAETWEAFHGWVKADFGNHLVLLRLLRHILLFEMNRPYETWYGSPETFPAGFGLACQDLGSWRKKLAESEREKAHRLEELQASLLEYAA